MVNAWPARSETGNRLDRLRQLFLQSDSTASRPPGGPTDAATIPRERAAAAPNASDAVKMLEHGERHASQGSHAGEARRQP